MNSKANKTLQNIRAELSNINQEVLDGFVESLQRHAYAARIDAHHSVRSILQVGGHSCSRSELLVVSGRDRTDSSGKVVLPIHQLLCGSIKEGIRSDARLVLVREPQFLATPIGADPVLVTANFRSERAPELPNTFMVDRDDRVLDLPALAKVEVEVMLWKPNGTAAAEVSFSWICTVEAARMVSFG